MQRSPSTNPDGLQVISRMEMWQEKVRPSRSRCRRFPGPPRSIVTSADGGRQSAAFDCIRRQIEGKGQFRAFLLECANNLSDPIRAPNWRRTTEEGEWNAK